MKEIFSPIVKAITDAIVDQIHYFNRDAFGYCMGAFVVGCLSVLLVGGASVGTKAVLADEDVDGCLLAVAEQDHTQFVVVATRDWATNITMYKGPDLGVATEVMKVCFKETHFGDEE